MGVEGAFADLVGPKVLSCRCSLQEKHSAMSRARSGPFYKSCLPEAFIKAVCDQMKKMETS